MVLAGYQALRSYGVDFMSLREWKDVDEIDEARKLKPQAAVHKIIAYCTRLENAIKAAIRRKQTIRLHTDNTGGDTKH